MSNKIDTSDSGDPNYPIKYFYARDRLGRILATIAYRHVGVFMSRIGEGDPLVFYSIALTADRQPNPGKSLGRRVTRSRMSSHRNSQPRKKVQWQEHDARITDVNAIPDDASMIFGMCHPGLKENPIAQYIIMATKLLKCGTTTESALTCRLSEIKVLCRGDESSDMLWAEIWRRRELLDWAGGLRYAD